MYSNDGLMHQNTPIWESSAVPPSLSPQVVHIWQSDLQSSKVVLSSFWKTLSLDEQNRANQFYFENLRNHFITGRGILRKLLGHYLQKAPEAISFDYNKYGKPVLQNQAPLQFNISHSAGVGLFAFTLGATIGVDIELIKNDIEIKKMTQRFFSKNEAQYILNLPEAEHPLAFFKCWTRKEAFIKGHGEGLSLPLDQFEVSIGDDVPTSLKAIRWNPKSINDWSLRSFNVRKNMLGAVAVRSKLDKIQYFQYIPH